MGSDEPSLGETIQLVGGRTAKFSGSGWRMTLWAWAEPSSLVIEVEWIGKVGQLSAFVVPSGLVSEASDLVLTTFRPGYRSASPLMSPGEVRVAASEMLDEAEVRSAQAAWRIARAVQEPEEPWNGRDGCWAETELWEDGSLEGRLGAKLPIGESAALDAAVLGLVLCADVHGLETDVVNALARWRSWCTPRPAPSRNQLKRRRN